MKPLNVVIRVNNAHVKVKRSKKADKDRKNDLSL